ncbi:hypothetical protein AVEN_37609-1 [Araneus ventricosus]|uniref:Uncharacterized protein n=1 Tax=Araneus ventricosus TaxID=182803 RepID=A0A4Y2PB79_ARAVE|nr:hypothetical protein AVEN_37609-1 [Araneus ventricosus]
MNCGMTQRVVVIVIVFVVARIIVVVCRGGLFLTAGSLLSGWTVSDEMVHGLAIVASLGLWSHAAFCGNVVGEFTAVIAPGGKTRK